MLKFKTVALTGAALALSLGLAYAEAPKDHQQKGAAMIERLCSDQSQMRHDGAKEGSFIDKLSLTDAQKSLWKDLTDARQQTRADLKTSLCSQKPDLSTLTGRLDLREKMMEARLAAFKSTRPKLEAFYNSLDDKQKTAFDAMRDHGHEHHGEPRHDHNGDQQEE
ncbi:Spy/CpxP family protein refolding chaperone [Methylovirgula sp. 4M-Z18]|uniref:Spy/CpxP family protein refolding chaperone n=1 Tax=Methylovirgula sp. 4M-Z18 TaxID=2293567 RepID=UPI001314BDB8|nr:Spy/CpxP family protein refolding chaperone [Methylovirgula sp. 4M-Z18]